ncbi:hypothetical protein UA08_01035 [Talaromyces atroroseus]|uniref:Cytochrome b5 heme-binding domain-containing protein n=1 Tax=Talaromyces atroroseus TaxID=1441469 RepID=A0A225AVN9_TALAT|nr:hypothetical protein UA08_01035 [Talaromyces atroroseus]OKL63683.1 hypothetical protein UA08_01035 [Talaromyces atroroseus]
MPGKILPTFTEAEVQSHNSKKSCYVIIDTKVYDVTEFLEGHPAGEDLILEYGGKDVKDIMSDTSSHEHSDSAYDILAEYHIGFLSNDGVKTNGNSRAVYERTGMADEADLSVETDYASDYKTHKFIDLSKPMFPQIWFGGFSKEFYLEQVHRPRHYKGGESAPLFGNFLEPLSKTPWWLPDNRVGITLHFLLHGIHHYLPMDKYRLVMPPALFTILALPFWKVAHAILYFNCLPAYYKELKKYHLQHHFADFENGFGVTSRFWDRVFGTELELPPPKIVKTQ